MLSILKFTSPIHMKLEWMIEQCIWNNPKVHIGLDEFLYRTVKHANVLWKWIHQVVTVYCYCIGLQTMLAVRNHDSQQDGTDLKMFVALTGNQWF